MSNSIPDIFDYIEKYVGKGFSHVERVEQGREGHSAADRIGEAYKRAYRAWWSDVMRKLDNIPPVCSPRASPSFSKPGIDRNPT